MPPRTKKSRALGRGQRLGKENLGSEAPAGYEFLGVASCPFLLTLESKRGQAVHPQPAAQVGTSVLQEFRPGVALAR